MIDLQQLNDKLKIIKDSLVLFFELIDFNQSF